MWYRQYRRELTRKDYENLKNQYDAHLSRSRGGCLTTAQREILLKVRKGEKYASEEQKRAAETDSWYRVKNTARDAIVDLRLISEIADEKLLKEIFLFNERDGSSPFTTLFTNLFPLNHEKLTDDQKWREDLLTDIIRDGLEWYVKKGVFQTDLEQQALFNTLDIISAKRYGRKIYKKVTDEFGNITIEKDWDYRPSVGRAAG